MRQNTQIWQLQREIDTLMSKLMYSCEHINLGVSLILGHKASLSSVQIDTTDVVLGCNVVRGRMYKSGCERLSLSWGFPQICH